MAKKFNTDRPTSPTPDFQSTPITTPNSAKLALTSPPILISPKTIRKSPRLSQKANSPSSKETPYDNNKDSSPNAKGSDNEKSSTAATTCFVRNFSSIAKFEEKIKKRTIHNELVEGEFDEDDYYVGYDDQYNDDDVCLDADDDYEQDTKKFCKQITVADSKRDASDQNTQETCDHFKQGASDQNTQEAGDNYEHEDAGLCDLEEGEIVEESQLEDPISNAEVNRKSDQKKCDLKFKWFIKQYIDEIAQAVKRIGVFW